MDEMNSEEDRREGVRFVDDNYADLVQRVNAVMPIADALYSKEMIHTEKYDEIRAEKTNQEKMRKLFESFKAGDDVKFAFYNLLQEHELHLFQELASKTGRVNKKRKLSDPEHQVPYKRTNTESKEQHNHNYDSAPRSTTNIMNNIVLKSGPPHYTTGLPVPVRNNPPPPKKEKNPPPPKKEKKPPPPKKEKKPPPPKKEKKPPPPKKEKKPPPPKKEKKPPPPKKQKKPPPPKKEKKPPPPKKEKKPPPPKTKKPSPPKKEKKPPPPKTKKPPAPKKR